MPEAPAIFLPPPYLPLMVADLEFQSMVAGMDGYLAMLDEDGNRWLKVVAGDFPDFIPTYSAPEEGTMRFYGKRVTRNFHNTVTSSHATPYADPEFDTVTEENTETGQEISEPYDVGDIFDYFPVSEWSEYGPPGADATPWAVRAGVGVVLGFGASVEDGRLVLGAFGSFSMEVRKTRWRVKLGKWGAPLGGMRLQIVQHKTAVLEAQSVTGGFVQFGYSNLPTGLLASGVEDGLTFSATVGPLGEWLDLTASGTYMERDAESAGLFGNFSADESLPPVAFMQVSFFFTLLSQSVMETHEWLIPFDLSQQGEFSYSEWVELPEPEDWYFNVWFFTFDYPPWNIVGGESLSGSGEGDEGDAGLDGGNDEGASGLSSALGALADGLASGMIGVDSLLLGHLVTGGLTTHSLDGSTGLNGASLEPSSGLEPGSLQPSSGLQGSGGIQGSGSLGNVSLQGSGGLGNSSIQGSGGLGNSSIQGSGGLGSSGGLGNAGLQGSGGLD